MWAVGGPRAAAGALVRELVQGILALVPACRWWTESAHDRWWTGPACRWVDWVSPWQAVACGCPGADVHPLVCEAGLEASAGCSWTGPGSRRVWVWSLPTGR